MTDEERAALLNRAADETNDVHDHDELHAAAAVVLHYPNWTEVHYLERWIAHLTSASRGSA